MEITNTFHNHSDENQKLSDQFCGLTQKNLHSEARILHNIADKRVHFDRELETVPSTDKQFLFFDTFVGKSSLIHSVENALQKERRRLNAKLESLKKERGYAIEELDDLRCKKEKVKDELQELKNEREEVISMQKKLLRIPIFGWMMAGAIEIVKQIEDYEDKIKRLNQDINKSNKKITNIEDQITEIEVEIKSKSNGKSGCEKDMYKNDEIT